MQEILADLKAKRVSYAEFLKRIAALAKSVHAGQEKDTPATLDTPGKRALFNNLLLDATDAGNAAVHEPKAQYGSLAGERALGLALQIDATVRRVRPNAFRGNKAKENEIKKALLPLLDNNAAEVERLFLVIAAQAEY